MLLHSPDDLRKAFDRLGDKIWIRATVGAAGQGALPADDFEFARIWIDRFKGWGNFTAAECLTPQTVTWLSLWYEGELVVAQTRRRRSWNFGNRTLSGVTGITGVGETCSDPVVDKVSLDAIQSIDPRPNGIFAVDMTYDHQGWPNPTEINIGRFFTTHYFFTKAGLNMPEIYCNIALDGTFPSLARKINPLPDGLIWIRGMDVEPVLTTVDELTKMERTIA
jgi:carbamoyl-phosphate synthase large subunit